MIKKFVVILKDKDRGSLSSELLEKHVAHLKRLSEEGRLYLCGPFDDDETALQVLLAADADEARSLVEADPFIRQRYYRDYSLRELIEANASNNWLMDHAQTRGNLD